MMKLKLLNLQFQDATLELFYNYSITVCLAAFLSFFPKFCSTSDQSYVHMTLSTNVGLTLIRELFTTKSWTSGRAN